VNPKKKNQGLMNYSIDQGGPEENLAMACDQVDYRGWKNHQINHQWFCIDHQWVCEELALAYDHLKNLG
jgi:hypothetical protein